MLVRPKNKICFWKPKKSVVIGKKKSGVIKRAADDAAKLIVFERREVVSIFIYNQYDLGKGGSQEAVSSSEKVKKLSFVISRVNFLVII